MELAEQVRHYQENIGDRNPETIREIGRLEVMALIGSTGAGKTTALKTAPAQYPEVFAPIKNQTTRKPGSDEASGGEFTFRKPKEVIADINNGNLVQVALGPNDDLYCTAPDGYPRGKIGLIAFVPSAVREFRRLPLKAFYEAFIVPPSYDVWQRWLGKHALNRSWSEEQLQERINQAIESYEFAFSEPRPHFVLNDDRLSTAARLVQVSRNQQPQNEDLASKAAEEIYKELRTRAGR